MNIRQLLSQRVRHAMEAAGIPNHCQAQVAPSKKTGFGDYQANGAMGAAKAMTKNPRELAQSIVDQLDLNGIAEKVEIAGPGFINIHLSAPWLATQLSHLKSAPEQSLKAETTETIVIDYSHPNLAKEMHVGHLRSTIIGDALARLLETQGHQVIRQNHVGDWGTQFGMLLVELEENVNEGESASLALKDLESFYQQSKQHFDNSEAFADKAREYVVRLQSGDKKMLALWEQFKSISLAHSQAIYHSLNVSLKPTDVRGESAYNDDLALIVETLKAQGLALEDKGAVIVFLEELADKEGKPSPVIVQKQGGGFLYATTDLAALRYRSKVLNAKRVLYIVDARQSLHLQQVFIIANKAGLIHSDTRLEHHPFGTMMGEDGKPFKTRSGATVKLADLLDEAIERAEALVREKNPELNDEDYKDIARKIGIGAVKYADLSKTRTNDYRFSWDSMLSFEGNTAPYLQYAFTRIQSIFRKADIDPTHLSSDITVNHHNERALALKLLQLPEVIDQVSKEAYPHLLCNYLYDTASLFMRFYESCPILKDGGSEKDKSSRLQLCDATAGVLQLGLGLLGIEVMERM